MVARRVARSRPVTEPDDYRDEEEEAPRSRRRSREEEPEEEERPRSRSRARDEDEDEDERPAKRTARNRDEDEDEDERPAKRTAKPKYDNDAEPEEHSGVHEGWGGVKKVAAAGKDYIKPLNFKEAKEAFLVKFIGDTPFASYSEHWIERKGKKSFTCAGNDCPLCDIGDKPAGKVAFNVIKVNDNDPTHELLILPPTAAEQLGELASGEKVKPLSKMYWEISRSGTGTKAKYNFYPIKDRDLDEDHQVEPLDDGELKAFAKKAYTKETGVDYTAKRDLKAIVAELDGEED